MYGLELLNSNALSSFSSTEKNSILNKLRSSYTYIQEEMAREGDRVNNVELTQLLSDVGDKLRKMEDDEVDYEAFAETVPRETSIIKDKTVHSSEELDPIEKVANWRKEVHKTSTGYNR